MKEVTWGNLRAWTRKTQLYLNIFFVRFITTFCVLASSSTMIFRRLSNVLSKVDLIGWIPLTFLTASSSRGSIFSFTASEISWTWLSTVFESFVIVSKSSWYSWIQDAPDWSSFWSFSTSVSLCANRHRWGQLQMLDSLSTGLDTISYRYLFFFISANSSFLAAVIYGKKNTFGGKIFWTSDKIYQNYESSLHSQVLPNTLSLRLQASLQVSSVRWTVVH